eukprot:3487592-Pyramimonas_sp.AAC.1
MAQSAIAKGAHSIPGTSGARSGQARTRMTARRRAGWARARCACTGGARRSPSSWALTPGALGAGGGPGWCTVSRRVGQR